MLVVDDESAIRFLCRINLELEGFRVLEAATAEEARERLTAEDVDVALVDVHIGSADGRGNRTGGRPTVLGCTASRAARASPACR